MRKIALICILLALSFALLPLCLTYRDNHKTETTPSEVNQTMSVFSDKSLSNNIINEALKYAEEDYCDEGLKALLILVRNNCEISTENNITAEDTNNVDLFKRLEKLLKESQTELFYNGEKVYIPLTELSSGYIKTSEEYPYITSVASPWDCLNPQFVYGKNYSFGISIYGLDYLCKEGLSCEEALAYYLRDFQIK